MIRSSHFNTVTYFICIVTIFCFISCVSTPEQTSDKQTETLEKTQTAQTIETTQITETDQTIKATEKSQVTQTQSQIESSDTKSDIDDKKVVDNSVVEDTVNESELIISDSDIVETTPSDNYTIESSDQNFAEPSVVASQTEPIIVTSELPEEAIPVVTPVEIYRNLTTQYTITPLSVPAPTTNGKPFKKDYKVCLLKSDTNEPASDVSLTVLVPSSKNNGVFEYTEVKLVTDVDGVIVLSCPIPTFSANTQISFFITPDYSNTTDEEITEIKQIAEEKSLKLPYQVKTSMMTKGGSIALLDFDKKGNAIIDNSVSSSALLTSLMRLGFSKIGNSDFSDQIAANKIDAMYKQANELFGTSVNYLIYGTIKYDGKVIKNDDGYTVKLIADINCYNMLTKEVIFSTILPISSTEKTEWEALNNARVKQLGPQLAELLLYGM